MPIQRPDYQLEFDLDVEEQTIDGGPLTVEEIRLRSEAARQALEGRTDLKWMEEYSRLRDGGWPWRVAAYIAWASSPRVNRIPKTQDELADQHLGLTSDRRIIEWRKKNPAIDEMVVILQASPLWDCRAEVFQALTDNAIKPDYKTHNDRKLFLEMTGDYVPSSKITAEMVKRLGKGTLDASELSDDDLREIAGVAGSELQKRITASSPALTPSPSPDGEGSEDENE